MPRVGGHRVTSEVSMTRLRTFIKEAGGSLVQDWPMVLLILVLLAVAVSMMSANSGGQWLGTGTTVNIGFGLGNGGLPQIGPLND